MEYVFSATPCVEIGYSYGAHDLKNISNVPDAKSCHKECEKVANCTFWIYFTESAAVNQTDKKTCWLKSSKDESKKSNKTGGVISSLKTCPSNDSSSSNSSPEDSTATCSCKALYVSVKMFAAADDNDLYSGTYYHKGNDFNEHAYWGKPSPNGNSYTALYNLNYRWIFAHGKKEDFENANFHGQKIKTKTISGGSTCPTEKTLQWTYRDWANWNDVPEEKKITFTCLGIYQINTISTKQVSNIFLCL